MLARIKIRIKSYIGSKILKLAFYFKDNYCKDVDFKSKEETIKSLKLFIYFKLYEWGCRFYM